MAEPPIPAIRCGREPVADILILHWAGEADTVGAVRSASLLDYPFRDLCVIANGTAPEAVERLRAACPGVTLLANAGNLGYAGGNNTGLRHALARGADHVLILNPDVRVEPSMLRTLIGIAEADPRIAAIGPAVLRSDAPDTPFHPGWVIDWNRWLFRRVSADPRAPDPREVEWVQGCALLLRGEFLRRHGLFDERFFLYCEDADLCLRARRLGWRTVETARARAWHEGYGSTGAASPLKTYYGLRNRLLFIAKHAPADRRRVLRLQLLLGEALPRALRAVGGLVSARPRAAWLELRAIVRAVWDWSLGRFGRGPLWLEETAGAGQRARPRGRRRGFRGRCG